MATVIVIYESKYGNTRLAAEAIMEGMGQVPETETTLNEIKEVDLNRLIEYDAVLLGSPNHIGSATRGIRKFIDSLGNLDLKGNIAVFDTYMAKDFEKAVKKMERQLTKKVPGLKLLAPGLSIRVAGMKGPIKADELPKCKDFGVKIATLLKEQA